VYGQTVYARTVDLGFAQHDRLILTRLDRLATAGLAATLKQEILALPGVRGASLTGDAPPLQNTNNTLIHLTSTTTDQPILIEQMRVDADFFRVYQIPPLAGRVFSQDHRGDAEVEGQGGGESNQGVVVNLASLGKLGIASAAEAVGKVVWEVSFEGKAPIRTTIIGVVPDLYFRSLRDPITPFLFHLRVSGSFGNLTVEMEPGRSNEVARAIEQVWSRLAAGVPIHLSYVDEELKAQYNADEQRGEMFAAFAVFAVLIACLGLFGLASFSAEKRTKEIGMRKVLGASVTDIVRLLVWQFSRPVLIANLIAWPVSFFLMERWLGTFRHAIDLTSPSLLLGIFGGAGLLAVLIAWATTAGHAYRVARARPSKALRCE
jgi:putative ABC transport system permease protein